MNPPKTNITVIVDYYFPSVRGGGPKKSVFLLQDLLKDKIKFNILSYTAKRGSTNNRTVCIVSWGSNNI